MQDLDWNDLRYILYLSRTGRIGSTARMLRVNETTVARRLSKVERQLGVRLFERSAGVLIPTESGKLVIGRAERIELDVDAVKDCVTNADSVAIGKVRVTAMPMVLNHVLIPALPALLQLHAGLQIELAADPRNLSLTNREADIALRMARQAYLRNERFRSAFTPLQTRYGRDRIVEAADLDNADAIVLLALEALHPLDGEEANDAFALAQLQRLASSSGNVFAELMETVKVASLGQASHALYDVDQGHHLAFALVQVQGRPLDHFLEADPA